MKKALLTMQNRISHGGKTRTVNRNENNNWKKRRFVPHSQT